MMIQFVYDIGSQPSNVTLECHVTVSADNRDDCFHIADVHIGTMFSYARLIDEIYLSDEQPDYKLD